MWKYAAFKSTDATSPRGESRVQNDALETTWSQSESMQAAQPSEKYFLIHILNELDEQLGLLDLKRHCTDRSVYVIKSTMRAVQKHAKPSAL